ncbi:MLO-like protein 1 [Zostera marina]|uniref:MLO-like protein n=1 Tax=Zostera marina TaxID=29655 RepID=A0A0K9P142_ZOSMR|nr:MLO-like protein 1 [Zostera marina]
MEGDNGGVLEKKDLELTPTWIIALVCSFIVFISLCLERFLHFLGKFLNRKGQNPLSEALSKVKEELMLLGFISLLLAVFQGAFQNICVPKEIYNHMLPCKREKHWKNTSHYQVSLFESVRRSLAGDASTSIYCHKKGKMQFLSIKALHDLHIFIFILAITHISVNLFLVILGLLRHSFGKQFYRCLTKSDYQTMRHGFIETHFPGNSKFNFHNYLMRTLEADFKKCIGVSWFLWTFVVVFILLNVNGWYTYFWTGLIPLILLLVIGTKLEHIISQLAHDLYENHRTESGELIIKPSDDHFWFRRPKIILFLINFIFFQNTFEIAFFFWLLVSYDYNSCLKRQNTYLYSRFAIGVIITILCSYSTLPLYTIVTQMGTLYNKEIFNERIQTSIIKWADKAKTKESNEEVKPSTKEQGSSNGEVKISRSSSLPNIHIELSDISLQRQAQLEEGIKDIHKPNQIT